MRILMNACGVLIALTMSLAGSVDAWAKLETYKLEGGAVKFDLPAGWTGEKDLLGVPLSLIGPTRGESQPVLTVLPAGELRLDEKGMKETEWQYRLGRRNFMEDIGGEVVDYRPYRKTRVGGHEAHVIGYRYKILGNEYAEMSYYLTCKEKTWILKSVGRDSTDEKVLTKIAESFQCE